MIGRVAARLWEGLLRALVYPGGGTAAAFHHAGPSLMLDGDGPVSRLFRNHTGRRTHKWLHFPALYDRYFAPFHGRPVRLLEIGVRAGGSLDIWRALFGPAATIVGIDIDPAVARRVTAPNLVRIGNQADPAFLARIVAKFGPFDIVIDDGSHIGADQHASLIALFPHLRDGGLYVLEDTVTAYWPGLYRGGLRRPGTAIETVKDLIDDMHAWAHGRPTRTGLDHIAAVHVHPTIVFVEKAKATGFSHVNFGDLPAV